MPESAICSLVQDENCELINLTVAEVNIPFPCHTSGPSARARRTLNRLIGPRISETLNVHIKAELFNYPRPYKVPIASIPHAFGQNNPVYDLDGSALPAALNQTSTAEECSPVCLYPHLTIPAHYCDFQIRLGACAIGISCISRRKSKGGCRSLTQPLNRLYLKTSDHGVHCCSPASKER